jgi:hypothetical protein
MAETAQMEAAVVRPRMFRPSFMMTPAHRKPTPVTTPWTTLVGLPRTCAAVPPYHNGANPAKMVNAVDATHTRP